MMETASRYVLSVITAAFVYGILSSMVDQKGSIGALLRIIGGLFVTFTILSPIVKLDFFGVTDFLEQFAVDGEYVSTSGGEMADEEYRTIIKEQVEAYILDKAKELGVSLAVEVTLSEDELPVPESARLRGTISPDIESQLRQILEDDLGIAKEDQQWIVKP